MRPQIMIFVFVLILIFGLITVAKSQHCGWDNSYIIILDVRDGQTGKVINDLDIVLTDSVGRPYASRWNLDNNKHLSFYQHTDTLRFGQNSKTGSQEYSKYRGPFTFGIDCYMLIVYYNNYPGFNSGGQDKILIKDKKGIYKNYSLGFGKGNISSLCTASSIWHSEDSLNRVKIYAKLETSK